MIPVAALARTDVLKDGASAIYGADAMAGVVNLVTRTDYEGLGLSVRQGITEKGDGSDFTADLLWGVRNARGDRKSVVVGTRVAVRFDLGGCGIIKKKISRDIN